MADISENHPLVERIRRIRKKQEEKEEELRKLEQEKKEEAEKLKQEMDETMQELTLEEEEKFLEEQKKKNAKENLQKPLEQVVEEEPQTNVQNTLSQNPYAAILIQPGEAISAYDIATPGMYRMIKELVSKSQTGDLSPTEKNILKSAEYHTQRIIDEHAYQTNKDEHNYLSRTFKILQGWHD